MMLKWLVTISFSSMDVASLKECLNKNGREELMIPVIDYRLAKYVFEIATWAVEGKPHEGRQVFFCVQNAKDIRNDLPPHVRCRILPVAPENFDALSERGPFDSLLLPEHGFLYSDPNLRLNDFWKSRGVYECYEGFICGGWNLWLWKSNQKPLKLFGMDHHHAVLWDMKQILRPLGIRLEFVWLCDGRPPVNEAIPSKEPPFFSSLDIYKTPPTQPLDAAFKERILSHNYDGIISSHSLITAYRLADLGLPMFHINSTRFGNEWIQSPEKHGVLVEKIRELLQGGRLRIAHNNLGDQMYFRQFFPLLEPSQELYIPSLCESLHRLRKKSVEPRKFLIWDTRQVLLQKDGSPFMKQLYMKLKQAHGDNVESQAVLLAQKQDYLPEGYLDQYTAVIHLPYNVSTMSIFQQTRANIPVWVPSKELLEALWKDPKEPNELSWTVFAPGSEATASKLDHVRESDTVKAYVSKADFYDENTMGCILEFSSIDELVQKIVMTDYQTVIDKSEAQQQRRRQEIFSAWEQMFQGIRPTA